MSGIKKPVRKSISQNELRKIMLEQKKKLLQTVKRIDSPLAKYSKDGQLSCILCGSTVKSEVVWGVHINSKQHKENIVNAKKRREDNVSRKAGSETTPVSLLEKACSEPPKKKRKESSPTNSFDGDSKSTSTDTTKSTSLLISDYNDSEDEVVESGSIDMKNIDSQNEKLAVKERSTETLPEGFFDDPVLDAKVRNVEYKDPIEEEWERFQRAIKEEATVSAQIIMEDQEEAIAERQIHEIDEQMRNWSRVIDLEKKKEEVNAIGVKVSGEDDDSSSSANEEEFEEYLDWRAKKS